MNIAPHRTLHLTPWHKSVSYGRQNLVIVTSSSHARMSHKSRDEASSDGFYAVYPEGWFFVALDEAGRAVFGWERVAISFSDVKRVDWSGRLFSREFSAEIKSGHVICFRYKTLVRQPWRIVTDIILPDDDWGLVCDLPSWADSMLKQDETGQELAKALHQKS